MFKKITNKVKFAVFTAKVAVMNHKAEGYVDSGVKMLIAVVIGALVLAGIYLLFDDIINRTVYSHIVNIFLYNG